MDNITVVFDADTQRFRANVDAAGVSVSKSAEAIAVARNKILDSFNQQVAKAKETGVSAERLASIQGKAAQQMASVTEQNVNKVINSLDRLAARQKAVTSELGNLKVPHVAENDISERQRASALLRGGGIRSAESFLSQYSAFNSVAKFAFPILGATTFVAEIIKGVVALKEMYDTAKGLPDAIKDGFESFNAPLMLGVDNLRKTNDTLEISIAKLEHKPANVLALALDEARIKADGLAESANKAYVDLKKLFAENRVGTLASAFTGQLETKPIEDAVNKQMRSIKDLERQSRDATRAGNLTLAGQLDSQVAAGQDALGAYARGERQKLKKYISDSHGTVKDKDGDAINNALDGVEDYANSASDMRSEDARNVRDSGAQKRLQEAATQRQQAAEAQRKAIEAQKKKWSEQDDDRHDAQGDDVFTDVSVWANRLKVLKAGSDLFLFAHHEFSDKLKAAQSKDAEETKQADAKAQRDERSSWDTSYSEWTAGAHRTLAQESDFWGMRATEAAAGSANYLYAYDKFLHTQQALQKQAEEADKARGKARMEQGQSATAYAEAALAIQQQTGQISKQDAAFQLANIHAEQYRQKMVELRAELARQDPDTAGSINAQAAIDKADADRKVQVMQDASAAAAASWQGALKNANAEWVQDAQDSAKQVVELYQQGIAGLNENLSNLMVGKKADWSGMFSGLGKTLANDALKKAEAPLLGAFGKADGSSANPYSVKIVGGSPMPGMQGTSLSDLGKSLFPSSGGDSDSGDSAASGFGGLMGKAVGFAATLFGGGLAVGGSAMTGKTFLVGEKGPELFTPPNNGTIIPNHALTGGGATTNYAIQVANGVTPEQMHMHVQAALQAQHPQVKRIAMDAMQDHQRRNISTKR